MDGDTLHQVLAIVSWTLGSLLVLAGAAFGALTERFGRPMLGFAVLVPLAVGAVVTGARLAPPAPAPGWRFAIDASWVALAVTGGAPLVRLVLGRVTRGVVREGEAGGILVAGDGEEAATTTEVMRGGGMIGYLERFAIAAAVGLGRIEVLAGIIALKGLGRFGELGTAAARERFIIGTLVSMIWGCACGAMILLG